MVFKSGLFRLLTSFFEFLCYDNVVHKVPNSSLGNLDVYNLKPRKRDCFVGFEPVTSRTKSHSWILCGVDKGVRQLKIFVIVDLS